MSSNSEEYGWLDRTVHRIAFGMRAPQEMLCDMEKSRFGDEIEAQPLTAPIFVTSLARAGTTLLLDVLARHPGLVAHSYRDMPFVRSPAMWRSLSSNFQAKDEAKERAHGDGMMVSADSPEAFEEVLWLHGFADHYGESGIALWDSLPETFRAELGYHMRSLIVSRDGKARAQARYISKNNANIARLSGLRGAFADARILVPLRNPLDHAASLLRQHELFTERHRYDTFGLRYMSDIGHFEFGAAHRPMLFEGMAEAVEQYDPANLDYWLAYWISAYRHVEREQAAGYGLIDMESFTAKPEMSGLLDWLGLEASPDVVSQASEQIRPIKSYGEYPEHSGALAQEVNGLYEALRNGPQRIL